MLFMHPTPWKLSLEEVNKQLWLVSLPSKIPSKEKKNQNNLNMNLQNLHVDQLNICDMKSFMVR